MFSILLLCKGRCPNIMETLDEGGGVFGFYDIGSGKDDQMLLEVFVEGGGGVWYLKLP